MDKVSELFSHIDLIRDAKKTSEAQFKAMTDTHWARKESRTFQEGMKTLEEARDNLLAYIEDNPDFEKIEKHYIEAYEKYWELLVMVIDLVNAQNSHDRIRQNFDTMMENHYTKVEDYQAGIMLVTESGEILRHLFEKLKYFVNDYVAKPVSESKEG